MVRCPPHVKWYIMHKRQSNECFWENVLLYFPKLDSKNFVHQDLLLILSYYSMIKINFLRICSFFISTLLANWLILYFPVCIIQPHGEADSA